MSNTPIELQRDAIRNMADLLERAGAKPPQHLTAAWQSQLDQLFAQSRDEGVPREVALCVAIFGAMGVISASPVGSALYASAVAGVLRPRTATMAMLASVCSHTMDAIDPPTHTQPTNGGPHG